MSILVDIYKQMDKLRPDQLVNFIGLLATMLAKAQHLNMMTENAEPSRREDRLLAVAEASGMLGMKKDYLYRHADTFPFSVRVGAKQLRFSLHGIEKYIARQRAVLPS